MIQRSEAEGRAMERSPRIEPPIVLLRHSGITAIIASALDAATWLEGLLARGSV